MDLSQTKLTKQEWISTEIPVSEQEKRILSLIMQGFHDPDIRVNHNQSLVTFMKIPMADDDSMDSHLYDIFFKKIVDPLKLATGELLCNAEKKEEKKENRRKPMKKADMIRIENMTANITKNQAHIFEFALLQLLEPFCNSIGKSKEQKEGGNREQTSKKESTKPKKSREVDNLSFQSAFSLYSLLQLRKATIPYLNRYIIAFVDACIHTAKKSVPLMDAVIYAEVFIEKNRLLGKYGDLTLFSHQRELFQLFNQPYVPPTLTLYIAPTGTGKTLSPLGLAQNGRVVIFVCSARHVGLSLARSAVAMEKRVAFAYGCASAEDIRLHNYAAVDYVVNKRSGAIAKVDNSNGSRVEIMICDVKSYLVAMHFLLEFHLEESIVMYWDEPTISMDYEDHPLHDMMHRVWTENRISRIVLSCATLPKETEIQRTLDDYLLRFSDSAHNAVIKPIVSFDFKKSISVLGQTGYCVLPHLLFADFRELLESVQHFKENKTLLRYLDLAEISRFIQTVATGDQVAAYFGNDISAITMTSLKLYYLELLEEVEEEAWPGLHAYFTGIQKPKFARGNSKGEEIHKIRSMTEFSTYSTPSVTNATGGLVGGSNSISSGSASILKGRGTVVKGGGELRRCSSVIVESTVNETTNKTKNSNPSVTNPFAGILFTTEDAWTLTDGPTIYIAENVENIGLFYIKQTAIPKFETDEIMRKIGVNSALQKKIEALEHDIEDKKGKDAEKDKKVERDAFSREVKELDKQLTMVREQIESVRMRMDYVPNTADHMEKFSVTRVDGLSPFCPNIGETDIVRIMELDIDNYKKVLLLLGIGVFTLSAKSAYLELMKEFATEQKLYMILASSDYIYGTNYAFCHGVVSKDLLGMTQQKTIQAMGRIGRNVVQQDYTVRFRNDAIIRNLFLPATGGNREAANMCRLFSSTD